jgi:hypothetical protein
MAKYCIILPCNIYVAPFYYKYENAFINLQLDFDLILWNRSGVKEKSKGNIISFDKEINSNDGDKSKFLDFVRFARFAKNTIKKNKYQKILCLSSYSATVALLSKFLSKKYKYYYWIDIRDYTYEYSNIYKMFMKRAILNSAETSISSPGFKDFLPTYDYLLVHNYNNNLQSAVNKLKSNEVINPIRISFIGNVRYYDQNKNILELFKNDDRFIIQFFGDGIDELVSYCKQKGINNVNFVGRFEPSQTEILYAKTDIINNCYGNSDFALKTSVSNKYYYSLKYLMPILVSENTYMEKLTHESGLGFTLKFEEQIKDRLFEWYNSLDKESIRINAKIKLDAILEDNRKFDEALRKFILTDKYR